MATIISDKFIFIHNPRCGGTSITDYFISVGDHWDRTKHEVSEHANSIDVYRAVGEEFWNSVPKIAVVRNPFDWMYSCYSYISSREDHSDHVLVSGMSFSEFCEWMMNSRQMEKYQPFYVRNSLLGDLGNNLVLSFEHLHENMSYVANVLGFPYNGLRSLNKAIGKSNSGYINKRIKMDIISRHYYDFIKYNYDMKI